MSEISAVRNAIRVEKTLAKTATGMTVDISKGYKVRTPDGTMIPFRPGTDLEKAKEWTKNFHNPGEIEIQTGQSFGNRIGLKDDERSFIDFEQKKNKGEPIYVTMSQVSKKGVGVGAGLYKKLFDNAKRQGVKVYSDKAMSQASVNVWLRFKELGYPIKEAPRKRLMSGGYENAEAPYKPLFEYDPTAGEGIKPQAGQTSADKQGPSTGMFTTPQAGLIDNVKNTQDQLEIKHNLKEMLNVEDDAKAISAARAAVAIGTGASLIDEHPTKLRAKQ